jgi:O-antigen/teichoic acid export membrane protein
VHRKITGEKIDNINLVVLVYKNLLKIIQFGLIKVFPGLANLALIPFITIKLGANEYGSYSLKLGYAILITTVLSAVLTQPMYRFLSLKKEGQDFFNSLMLALFSITFLVSSLIVFFHKSSLIISLGFGLYSASALLSAYISVRLQIDSKIFQLAKYEALRLLIFISIIIFVELANMHLAVNHLLIGLILSNVVPFISLSGRLHFKWFSKDWLISILNYGSKSSIWLLMAGIPIVASKTILSKNLNEFDFGIYALIADITYRGFGFLNSAVNMWAFPNLSRIYESKDFVKVKQMLTFSLSVYAIFGAILLFTLFLILNIVKVHLGSLSLISIISIFFANLMWQSMSIAHKPLELSIRTGLMVVLLFLGVIIFFLTHVFLHFMLDYSAILSVTIPTIIIACFYNFITFNAKLS